MKENWTYRKLGEVANVTDYVSNGSFASLRENVHYMDKNGYAILVRLADYTNGFDSTRFVYIDEHAYNYLAKSKLYGGEIIMSNVGSIGKSFICPKLSMPMSLAPNSIVINTPNNKFYFYYFNRPSFQNALKAISTKTALPKFNKTQFKTLTVPIPPLPVQERIVSELDLLSGIIEKKKEQLKEYEQLAQAIFYDMFGDPVMNEKGWEVKRIGDLALVKTGPFGSMLHKDDYISNGIPLVNPIHMKDFHIVADTDFTISDEKADELNKYILHKNDVVFARRGDIGRCAVVSEKEDGYLCGTGSLFVRFVIEVVSTYIMYIIRSHSFTKELISNAKGATMLNLNSSIIEEIGLPLPPLSLQKQFAEKIEAIEKQKVLIKQSIQETETLFNSRMDYYFG